MKQQERSAKQPPARILVVDDEAIILHVLCSLLEQAGYSLETANDGPSAQEKLANGHYDVVISDIMMPGFSGLELVKKQSHNAPDMPFIMITGNPNLSNAAEAIRTGATVDYLIKPVTGPELIRSVSRAVEIKKVRDENRRLEAENLRYQKHLEMLVQEKSIELINAYDDLSRSYDFTLEALVAMLDAREKSAGRHSVRVREFAMILAHELDVPACKLDDIARGTLLHDIGKIGIPDSILLKPDELTEEEWTIMKTHPQIGYDIIRSSTPFAAAAEIILEHHEKYDGSGYPRGLKGEEICLGARIFSVVDAYDAMRSIRIYKSSIPAEPAIEEIRRCSGTLFDPVIVQAFLTSQPLLEEIAQWDLLEPTLP